MSIPAYGYFVNVGRSKQQNATMAVTFAALLDLTFVTAVLLNSFFYRLIIEELPLHFYY